MLDELVWELLLLCALPDYRMMIERVGSVDDGENVVDFFSQPHVRQELLNFYVDWNDDDVAFQLNEPKMKMIFAGDLMMTMLNDGNVAEHRSQHLLELRSLLRKSSEVIDIGIYVQAILIVFFCLQGLV